MLSHCCRTAGAALSEWGAYGVYLGAGSGAAPLLNEYAGHLVRTKLDGVDEGGVATGYAFLSSPILVDEQAEGVAAS
jgi:glutathione synthase